MEKSDSEELDLKNAVQPHIQPESVWQSPGFWMISGLLVISALLNFLGTSFFWNLSISSLGEALLCSALGLLVGEICLIGIWLAFGSQTLLLRAGLALGSLFAMTCLYLMGLFFHDNQSLPAEVPLIILGISFALVGVLCIPLGLVRWKAKRVISRRVVEQDIESSQFGIRHLLIVTALTAVLVVLGQNSFPETEFEGDAPWVEISCFFVIYMLLSCLICLLSLATVFDQKRRLLNLFLLAGVVLVGANIAATIMFLNFSSFRYDLSGNIFNSIAYSGALALGLVAVLAAFFAAGYKFQRS